MKNKKFEIMIAEQEFFFRMGRILNDKEFIKFYKDFKKIALTI